jgi:electron transfer flavoprotein beta subunit
MTMPTRPARCWRRCWAGPGHVRQQGRVGEGDGVDVTREVDGGLQTVGLKLPAIVTTDLRLNEPRYASPAQHHEGAKKPLDETKPETLGVDVAPRLKVLKTGGAGGAKAGVKVGSVAELVSKLKTKPA